MPCYACSRLHVRAPRFNGWALGRSSQGEGTVGASASGIPGLHQQQAILAHAHSLHRHVPAPVRLGATRRGSSWDVLAESRPSPEMPASPPLLQAVLLCVQRADAGLRHGHCLSHGASATLRYVCLRTPCSSTHDGGCCVPIVYTRQPKLLRLLSVSCMQSWLLEQFTEVAFERDAGQCPAALAADGEVRSSLRVAGSFSRCWRSAMPKRARLRPGAHERQLSKPCASSLYFRQPSSVSRVSSRLLPPIVASSERRSSREATAKAEAASHADL